MKAIGFAILLAATWLYAVGHAQLQPDAFLIEHAESWSGWVLRTGLAQVASVVILMAGMWRASGGKGLAVWLGVAFVVGWSPWLLTSSWPEARSHLGFAALWFLLCLVRPRFGGPGLIFLQGGIPGWLGFAVGQKLSQVDASGRGLLAWRTLANLAALVLTFLALKPVEEWFNRDLLLAGQKQKLSIGDLARPNGLTWWVEHLGHVQDVGPEDLQIAEWLHGQPSHLKAMVLTPARTTEKWESTRILTALAGGRPFYGWLPNAHEMTPTARQLRAGKADYTGCGLDLLILRGPHSKPALNPLTEHVYGISNPPLDTVDRLQIQGNAVPGGVVRVDKSPGLAHVGSHDPPFQVLNQGELWLPFTPGTYPLGSGTVEIRPGIVNVQLEIPSTLPSRSLVPLQSHWTGQGENLGAYRGVRLVSGPLASPIQKLEGELPQDILLWFSTPELEGENEAEVQLIGPNGEVRRLGSFRYRTWRRLPPVGF